MTDPNLEAVLAQGGMRLLAASTAIVMALMAGVALDVLILVRLRGRGGLAFRHVDRVRSTPWTWHDIALAFVFVLVLHVCLLTGLGLARRLAGVPDAALRQAGIALQALILPAAVITVPGFLLRRRGLPWGAAFALGDRPLSFRLFQGIVFYVAALPLVVAYAYGYLVLLKAVGYPLERQDVIRVLLDPANPPWLRAHLVVLALVGAPLVEEFFFRGTVFPALAKRFRPGTAVVLASLLFAGLHLHLPSVVPLFVIAVAFTLAYTYTGCLIVPIVMHALFNTASLTLLWLLRDIVPLPT
jgi:membrane protease YdiL (CAAX protease family)